MRARAALLGVPPDVFDGMDWDEADDMLVRMERLHFERDKLIMGFLAKLFETTTYILGSGLGLKLEKPERMGEEGEGDRERNDRGELNMMRDRKPGEVRPGEVMGSG